MSDFEISKFITVWLFLLMNFLYWCQSNAFSPSFTMTKTLSNIFFCLSKCEKTFSDSTSISFFRPLSCSGSEGEKLKPRYQTRDKTFKTLSLANVREKKKPKKQKPLKPGIIQGKKENLQAGLLKNWVRVGKCSLDQLWPMACCKASKLRTVSALFKWLEKIKRE